MAGYRFHTTKLISFLPLMVGFLLIEYPADLRVTRSKTSGKPISLFLNTQLKLSRTGLT